MIPLRDDIPRERTPYAVLAIILANVLLHFYVSSLPPFASRAFNMLFGVVPARYLYPDWADFMGFPATGFIPFVSYMFLHNSLWHLLANMWMLWIFADNIEDVMGPLRFVAFYLLCGLAALATHMYFNMEATLPIIGASGAVAGVMGAYIVLYPRGKVLTLIPIIIIPYIVRLPAWLFLGFWFLTQVFAGLFEELGAPVQGIAWWAHVGGFLAGAFLIRVFMRPELCEHCQYLGFKKNFTFEP